MIGITRSGFFKVMIFILIIIIFISNFYIPRLITEIRNPLVQPFRKKYINEKDAFYKNKVSGKYIHFRSFDDTQLSGYLTYSTSDINRGTVILLHGIRSRKEIFQLLSEKLAHAGFNTVALDSRAHGASEGIHCTFGVKEKRDISSLLDFLNENENITSEKNP